MAHKILLLITLMSLIPTSVKAYYEILPSFGFIHESTGTLRLQSTYVFIMATLWAPPMITNYDIYYAHPGTS